MPKAEPYIVDNADNFFGYLFFYAPEGLYSGNKVGTKLKPQRGYRSVSGNSYICYLYIKEGNGKHLYADPHSAGFCS